MSLLTFQDFQSESNKPKFINRAINNHLSDPMYETAKIADLYDKQMNVTINEYVKVIFTMTGTPIEDFTASNNKIASNYFHRLNTQRCTYLLGNGVSFSKNTEQRVVNGVVTTVDSTKDALGNRFDTDLKNLGYYALIHGVSFGFWNMDRLHIFPLTEFVPLWDEETGALRAGIRFWRLAQDKPMMAVLYEEDGYTKYKTQGNIGEFEETQAKKAYKTIISYTEDDGDEVVGEENYSSLPIVPLWGSRLKQSTLVGMRHAIDSYDLVRSGFANDLSDCAQIYWILENCGGMDDNELARFRDRLKITHIAAVDTDNSAATPYTQDIPYAARKVYLDHTREGIYEDFGGLDVHTVAAGATNDHIDAAYQPLDEEADDFEYQVVEFIQQILKLIGIEDTPVFKRNRISNQMEQVQMVIMEANYLDDETILQKLPNVTVDEVANILARKTVEDQDKFEEEATEGFSLASEDEDEQTPA